VTIEEAYPGAKDAVWLMENVGHDQMEFARSLKMSPERTVELTKRAITNVVAFWTCAPGATPNVQRLEQVKKGLAQLDHPDFLAYVTHKLNPSDR
jgi:hypothetical protein